MIHSLDSLVNGAQALYSVKRLLQKWAVETMKTEQIRSRRGHNPWPGVKMIAAGFYRE